MPGTLSEPRRALHLNAFLHHVGHHEAAWRLPESDPSVTTSVRFQIEQAQIAERGLFDSVFLADGLALAGDPRFRPVGLLEPTTLLGALAVATDRIGLIATASTTYSEPYDLARRFASLDHISGGRCGWNIVTTADLAAAANFGSATRGSTDPPAHAERYARAEEFLDVATKLWDSWEDAAVADKLGGVYADARKIHPVNHAGTHFRVAGALNVPRPPQGHPLLVQAGSSEAGRTFAARHAEAVFTASKPWPTVRRSTPTSSDEPPPPGATRIRSRCCPGSCR